MALEHLRHGLPELAGAEAVDEADLPAVGERRVVEQLVDALLGLLDRHADQAHLGGDGLGEEESAAGPPKLTPRERPSARSRGVRHPGGFLVARPDRGSSE